MPGALLTCPIRGPLTVPEKAADNLTYTEEKRRIDCIKFLLAKGYPPTHFKIETTLLRFGHGGRNSFRTDLAVLDVPVTSLADDLDVIKDHIVLIGEVKRDNAKATLAKATQVYPALDFLPRLEAFAVYWDDIEQRLFYRTVEAGKTKKHETTLALLPKWGERLRSRNLRRRDLHTTDLRRLFEKIEDRLHAGVADKTKRFEIMLQLLIAKLYDEHAHQDSDDEMELQDFSDSPLPDKGVIDAFDEVLRKAVGFYQKYLPNRVPTAFRLPGSLLRDVSQLLAPIRILGSKRDLIQDFYMYFATQVYKWDLAQYFTPTEVVDFIVTLGNPRAGDQVKDPACGSADFLISAMHYARNRGADLRDAVFGADTSENAVQIAVLNMVLNGDGKSNIKQEDSLVKVLAYEDQFSLLLCNPPFGSRITERRFDVLRQFDLGHVWEEKAGHLSPTRNVLDAQEVGLLFFELCVRQVAPGGRVGIILPNGYLGNRGAKHLAFREWLLRHTKLVAVIAFPRFTFKKSGADVSASVVVVEKRKRPLSRASLSSDYHFYPGILESVGWSVGVKGADPIYVRRPEDGSFVTDTNNELILNADFDRVLKDFWGSEAASNFPWVTKGLRLKALSPGWSVRIEEVAKRADLSIDAKRWSERVTMTRELVKEVPHIVLSDIVDIVQEGRRPNAASEVFDYVELINVADGVVTPARLRGWELPDRAKHRAAKGEIFVGAVWGSVGKWFVAGGDTTRLVVTNGFHRLRLKKGREECLPDLIAALNTETYRIQARAFAAGSDGLAELPEIDLASILIPKITDPNARKALENVATQLLAGRSTVASLVTELVETGQLSKVDVAPRTGPFVQV